MSTFWELKGNFAVSQSHHSSHVAVMRNFCYNHKVSDFSNFQFTYSMGLTGRMKLESRIAAKIANDIFHFHVSLKKFIFTTIFINFLSCEWVCFIWGFPFIYTKNVTFFCQVGRFEPIFSLFNTNIWSYITVKWLHGWKWEIFTGLKNKNVCITIGYGAISNVHIVKISICEC